MVLHWEEVLALTRTSVQPQKPLFPSESMPGIHITSTVNSNVILYPPSPLSSILYPFSSLSFLFLLSFFFLFLVLFLLVLQYIFYGFEDRRYVFGILSHLWRMSMDSKATRIALYNQQLKEEERVREERAQQKRAREKQQHERIEQEAAQQEQQSLGPAGIAVAAAKRKELFYKRLKAVQEERNRPRSFHLQAAINILKATMTKDMLICRMEREFYSKYFRMLPRDEPLIAGNSSMSLLPLFTLLPFFPSSHPFFTLLSYA